MTEWEWKEVQGQLQRQKELLLEQEQQLGQQRHPQQERGQELILGPRS